MEKTLRVIAECFANRIDKIDQNIVGILREPALWFSPKIRRDQKRIKDLRFRKMILLDISIALTSASIELGKEK